MIECSFCKKQITNCKFLCHINNHIELTEIEKCNIYESSIPDNHYKKIYKCGIEFIKFLFNSNKISSFLEFQKCVELIRSFNAYIKVLEQFKQINTEEIIFNFFTYYVPYKKLSKSNTSFKLALAFCGNNEEEAKKFYNEIIIKRNPFYKHDGKLSPFSKDFCGYKNISDEEKTKLIRLKCYCKDRNDFNTLKKNVNTSLDYYLNKGLNKEDAEKELIKRQSTFSLKKCIEKYGEEEGRKRFDERNKKWLKSLNTLENREKIKKGQELGIKNSNKKGYSDISQKLFFAILKKLDIDSSLVYFALNNGEYIVYNFAQSIFRLDFYIPSLNKWIEFDGEYWHGKKRGNQKRDKRREQRIIELMPNIQLKRVRELDFLKNPDVVINECVSWINE